MGSVRSRIVAFAASACLVGAGLGAALPAAGAAARVPGGRAATATTARVHDPRTPIHHLVVIFDENVSFDHYFGTYPFATNPKGEPRFHAAAGTPWVDGLYATVRDGRPTGPLLTANPNESNPLRLSRNDPLTCDQDHDYTTEQNAADHGAEDRYAQETGSGVTLKACLAGERYRGRPEPVPAGAARNYAVMDYYDGNTVTALWNFAQHFAMSDDMFGTNYGPSTPGALNVTAAQTYGARCGPSGVVINASPCTKGWRGYDRADPVRSHLETAPGGRTPVSRQPAAGKGTVYSDSDPYFDICSYLPAKDGGDADTPADTIEMGGNNIGEELTAAHVTWGWFQGGFDDGYVPGHGRPPSTAKICSESHRNVGGVSVTDFVPHHEPFQYFASTANPMHLPPSSVRMIGRTDRANHQYDIADFWAAADRGWLPSVSYLKAPAYENGHAGYSDPLDEQRWLVTTVNRLERLPTWRSTAAVITWDDSDGWYDHVLGTLLTQSQVSSLDTLTAPGQCGDNPRAVPHTSTGRPEEGRCGLGPRLPFLLISPWARANFVGSWLMDQSSVVRFIEDNWGLRSLGDGAADAMAGSILGLFDFHRRPAPRLFLNPSTGEPARR